MNQKTLFVFICDEILEITSATDLIQTMVSIQISKIIVRYQTKENFDKSSVDLIRNRKDIVPKKQFQWDHIKFLVFIE